MAGDWIQMRVGLRKDPTVGKMAKILAANPDYQAFIGCHTERNAPVTRDVTRDVTERNARYAGPADRLVAKSVCVAGLLQIWGVARELGTRQDDDLSLPDCGLDEIDDLAETPGLGSAMAAVGWLQITNDGHAIFPKWFAAKQSPAEKHRTPAGERQARYRAKKAAEAQAADKQDVTDRNAPVTGDVTRVTDVTVTSNVTRDVTSDAEEKRRGEKSKEEEEGSHGLVETNIQPVTPDASPSVTPQIYRKPTVPDYQLPMNLTADGLAQAWVTHSTRKYGYRKAETVEGVFSEFQAILRRGHDPAKVLAQIVDASGTRDTEEHLGEFKKRLGLNDRVRRPDDNSDDRYYMTKLKQAKLAVAEEKKAQEQARLGLVDAACVPTGIAS